MVILEKRIKDAVDVKVELLQGKLQLSIVAEPLVLLDGLKEKIEGSVDDAFIEVFKLVIKNVEKV